MPMAVLLRCLFNMALPLHMDLQSQQGLLPGKNMTAVSAGISGLSPATTYHFRAEGTNISGTSYGTDSVFTTSSASPVPTVITDGATNINQTTATLKAVEMRTAI